jgi:hypothetical protein
MIRFGRIELAIYLNKALDLIDSIQKRLLTRVRFGSAEPNHENLKYQKKN